MGNVKNSIKTNIPKIWILQKVSFVAFSTEKIVAHKNWMIVHKTWLWEHNWKHRHWKGYGQMRGRTQPNIETDLVRFNCCLWSRRTTERIPEQSRRWNCAAALGFGRSFSSQWRGASSSLSLTPFHQPASKNHWRKWQN